ncbi:12863_t:CDS:2, partial [Ambispora leptoticha]
MESITITIVNLFNELENNSSNEQREKFNKLKNLIQSLNNIDTHNYQIFTFIAIEIPMIPVFEFNYYINYFNNNEYNYELFLKLVKIHFSLSLLYQAAFILKDEIIEQNTFIENLNKVRELTQSFMKDLLEEAVIRELNNNTTTIDTTNINTPNINTTTTAPTTNPTKKRPIEIEVEES